MKNKYSYLSKNVLLFSLSGFVPKILSFILVPIYTSYLTTAEYGISDLITTTVALLLPIFTLDIQDAVMRFALDKHYKKEEVFSIALKIILIGSIFVFLGAYAISFLDFGITNKSYIFFFCIMYIVTALDNTISLFCRGIDKVNVMVTSSILNSIISLSANILFLVVFKWGLTGYLIANTVGSLISLIWSFFRAKLYVYLKFKTSSLVLREMVKFSFPLIFSVIAWWINNASDRYILTWIAGVSVSGLYAVAYKIPTLLSVFQNVFTQAWSISAIKEFDKDDSDGFIGNMYTMMNFAMIVVCSLIMMGNIVFAKILYSRDFFDAWRFVPPLLISVVFNAMALFIGSIFTAVKDTKTLSYSTIAGAMVNTICNFLFIHFWSGYGAALATMFGYAVTLFMRHFILKKHIKMKIHWKRDVVVYALLIIQMILANLGVIGIFIQVIPFVAIMILYKVELNKLINLIKINILKLS